MSPHPETPIVVAAHDAGAANHLIAWLQAHPGLTVRACMRGPALRLWQLAFPGVDGELDPAAALDGARTLLSGTGWASRFEHDARIAARRHGVRVVALIDHWTNYQARFECDGVTVVPDEIWVTDDNALALAERFFPGISVVQQPNLYLERLVREVAMYQGEVKSPPDHVLYLLEPIRDAWGQRGGTGEFDALDFFIRNLDLLAICDQPTIRLRPHPSDPAGKYDQWIQSLAGMNVKIDDEPALAKSLAWAGTVAGCQTYAMVVALAAHKRVFSSVPPGAPPCLLPHSRIVKMAELTAMEGPQRMEKRARDEPI